MEKLNLNSSKIKGILVDLDGTLYFKGNPIPGSIEAVSKLKEMGIKLLFLTNTDSKTPISILKMVQGFGFLIEMEEIFTPIIALKKYLSNDLDKKSYIISTKEVAKEFKEYPQIKGSEIPDFVIISDFHDNWDVHHLNNAFKYVLKGAKLLGTQGNKYYLDQNGEPVIDTGSFVEMIANAANVIPKIFGKPSKEYFLQALEMLNLNHNEVLVIGDDINSDINGAINANIKGILVKTGKGQYYDSSHSDIKLYLVLESFSSILKIL
jgi:HAD superfamily hydrolase (TIGR01458 family)